MSDLELDVLVATLKQAGNWHCDKAATAITTLRARIAALEADAAKDRKKRAKRVARKVKADG